MIRKRKIVLILTALATLFLFATVTLNLVFRFMDISQYRLQIAQEIEKTIKRKVSIGNARLSFVKGLDIILENVAIKEKDKEENFITSNRFVVSFYFLPLFKYLIFKKHLAIKKVQIIGPRVQIYRSHEGKTNLVNWINEVIPNKFFSEIQTKKILLPIMKKLIIKNGQLILQDTKVSETPLITKVSDFNLELVRPLMKRAVTGIIQGKILNDMQPTSFRIETEIKKMAGDLKLENLVLKGNINLSSLNINQFQPYIKQFFRAKKWNGIIDLNAIYEGSFAGGIKSIGKTEFRSLGLSQSLVLSDPLKVHQWGIDYDLFLDKEKLDINKFKIKSTDLTLTGKTLIEQPFSKNPFIGFELQSTPFELKSFFSNIPLSLLPSSLREFQNRALRGKLKFKTLKFNGKFHQLKNIHLMENFKLFNGEISAEKVDFRIGLDGITAKNITGELLFDEESVKLSNMSGAYKNSTISMLSGIISKPFKDPAIDISTRASLQLDQLFPVLASKPSFFDNVWKNEKIDAISGKAEIQIHLSGDVKKPLKLRHSGNIELKNVAFTHNDLVHNLSNINGKVKFYSNRSLVPSKDKDMTDFLHKIIKSDSEKGKLFYISSLSGKYGQSEILNITGGILDSSIQPVLNLKIEIDALLNEIHPILVTYLNVNDAFEDMNNVNIISGRSKVIVQINNNLSETNGWDISGGLRLNDVHASHNRFPLFFSRLKGNIFFTKNKLEWKGLNGLIGNSTFSINGKTLDYASKNPKIALKVNGDADLNEIWNILNIDGKENFVFNGTTGIKLNLNGDYNAIKTTGELDLTKSFYQYKKWIKKRIDQKNTVTWDGLIEKLNNFYFEKFEATYEGNKIIGNGAISGLIKPHLNINIYADDFKLADAAKLAVFFNNELTSGKLSTSFNVKGNLKGKKPLEVKGKAAINNGSFKFDFSPNTISNIKAKFSFNNQKVSIKNLSMLAGKSDATIKGEIVNFDKPVFTLKLKSKNLDLNQFLPRKIRSINEINSLLKNSPLFLVTSGKIDLDTEKGEFSFLKFPHLNGKIQLKDGVFIFDRMKIFFSKKYISADANLNFLSDHGLDFSLKLRGKSFEAKKFESVFQQYFKDGITGRLSLTSRLMGKGSNLEQIAPTLSGDLSLLLIKGDYNKQNLISGIKQILGFGSEITESDIPLTASMEYDQIKGNFVIDNGVAITENYVIDTPERRTSVIGSLDLGNKKLDLSVGVAPWQNLNKKMSKIPIVGTIVTGNDGKGLFISYYNVKGKMGSPEVKSVPIKSLGKKMVSLFKGIFQAPKEILVPSK